MPKITHDRSLHSSAPRPSNKKDVFAKSEKESSFVNVPKAQLDLNILQSNIKPLSGLPLKLNIPESEDMIDRRPQPLAKKEKRKQKKEAFLKKLEPFAKKSTSTTESNKSTSNENRHNNNNNNNSNKSSLNSSEDLMAALLSELSDDDDDENKPKNMGNSGTSTMTTRKKKKIALKEIEQYKNVLAHPSYQSDPFATLKEHLSNSVQIQNEKMAEQNKLRNKQNDIMKKQPLKKKDKKSSKKNPYYDAGNKMDLN
ncbi:hypothetical protein PPL_04692 [Heterostelium album PN500]|uniref:Ribosome biogenesis protein SLX9 n=1 Tax=Heterostelium pallidum (strain ATCC 26659 / Pp 5 / PN500) TaxID=670386 RepID=D3B8A1_HETP5|nr:hypothetical protein PPL_04692 [Heterostelium album PN500]EFA82269.1 hypothetical protein PPL_04692 [Heterostelium album PN500]|eukprot:XP_020434386.1 hypothetical protein PPL_04692 [Heterostelium album PN500]